jgi:YHS domain-containing protein
MKARWLIVPLGMALLISANGFSAAESGDKKEFKATCPVSGRPAVETSSVELKDGSTVYFCCDNCPAAFEKSPKKFTMKVNAQLLQTGQIVQVACPITGKPVNKETTFEGGELEVGMCCKNCLAKVGKADDEAKLKLLFSEAAMKKGFTHQTTCPVSGKDIDPAHFVTYQKEKVYFCCPNCPGAFEKDPTKFVAKLPQFKKAGDKAR